VKIDHTLELPISNSASLTFQYQKLDLNGLGGEEPPFSNWQWLRPWHDPEDIETIKFGINLKLGE
jgi:hypothetical protein